MLGVCVYINNDIPCIRRVDLECENLECLWLSLRPKRLPRPLSGIVICVVYHPPGLAAAEHNDLKEYLINTIDLIRNKHPDHGLVILGDFNDLEIRTLSISQNLKQVVDQPTRESAILDLILTNLHNLYDRPDILAPLGSSDHNIVHWLPSVDSTSSHNIQAKSVKSLIRRYPRSGIDAFGRWVTTQNWFSDLEPNPTVDTLAVSFTNQLIEGIDRIFPQQTSTRHYTDKPWITPAIKQLIKDRQKAFHGQNTTLWKTLKYKVQHEIKVRKTSYYKTKVKHLKKDDCRMWWKIVNKMAGKSEKNHSFSLEHDGRTLNQSELVKALNVFYASVSSDIPPLDVTALPAFLPAKEPIPTIQPYEVARKLLEIKPFKAHGPDNIPCRILKEFAYELADPVATIFNASLTSAIVPAIWKDSDIIPIPKSQPPTCEGDTRPISLTPCLAKVLEDFVVRWMITDIEGRIDPKQFGCLKGTSTTYCLLDMIHTWLRNLESPEKHLRLCFLDFAKAFDRIGHNILILKLLDLGVRSSLLPWIINFLSNRRHRVKHGGETSDWLPMNAGVPQGTKLGPILFLVMINDLDVKTHAMDIWKFVDDISTSEGITKDSNSKFQSCIDSINSWASCNLMKLNPKKCKELRVCFLRETPDLSPLLIDGHALEVVRSHKVLGLVIQNDLKWNEHIESVVSKASKRLYIIRTLRRGGVPAEDLLTIYFALIRSVLEYCCVVWHHSIPLYLANEVERVQRRALKIILPGYSYKEALIQLGCSRLDERREQLCLDTLEKIQMEGPLSKYVPLTRASSNEYQLRNSNTLTLIKCRTERYRRSFFPSTVALYNNSSDKT